MANKSRKSFDINSLPKWALVQKQIDFFYQNDEIQNPFYNVLEGFKENKAIIDGKEYILYAAYNYLGLARHPYVLQKAIEAINKFGTSCSASRMASGNRPVHEDLEHQLARFLGTEACIIFVAGYLTNESTIGHLMGPKDLIVYDELSHRSLLTGCIESGAKRIPFLHNDLNSLREILKQYRKDYENALIITEGVFSMDGDIPNLPEMIQIKNEFEAWLMVDEAHSMGTLGNTGRGIAEYFQLENREDVEIWMGTLSKSLASCGGYIAGSKSLVTYLKATAPGLIYSAGMTPANAAAALAALELIKKEPERMKRLQANSAYFLKQCQERGINTGNSRDTPVIPCITGSSIHALYLCQALLDHGISLIPILYPVVPEAAARLRFFITSEHTKEQMDYTLDILDKEWKSLSKRNDLGDFLTFL